MSAELLPHQLEAAGKMHNGCILKGSTGSGKTITALAYYDDTEQPERLIVITTGKKRDSGDWQAEAQMFAIFPEVDSWNNIGKYADIKGAFFIFDEQRVVGSGPWVKSFLKITKNNKWVMLSATPGDGWMDYIPVFVANGFYRNRTDFLEQHVEFDRFSKYPKVKRYHGTLTLIHHLDSILVTMSFEKKTKTHEIIVGCEYDKEAYDVAWRRRWNEEEGRPIRHVSELFAILRRVVNRDRSRFERVINILGEHPKLIIFYNFDYELEILKEGLKQWPLNKNAVHQNEKTGESSGLSTASVEEPCGTSEEDISESFAVAEWNGHKHEKLPQSDSWIYLVQYMAGSEGWNCIETDTVLFYSLTYSYRMFHQAKGRIDRLNTPFDDLYYYILRSPSPIDSGIVSKVSQKRNFNEKEFLKEMAGQ